MAGWIRLIGLRTGAGLGSLFWGLCGATLTSHNGGYVKLGSKSSPKAVQSAQTPKPTPDHPSSQHPDSESQEPALQTQTQLPKTELRSSNPPIDYNYQDLT